MNYKDKNLTIGEVVTELPTSSRIFSEYGIDFCCGGNRKLYVVINEQGLDENKIYEKLEAAEEERKSGYSSNNLNSMEPSALVDYIEDTHHGYLRRTMPEITDLLATILRVHGKNHPELFEVYKIYGNLKADLEQHLLKEETILFPAFSEERSNQEEIRSLTSEIVKEHLAAGELLEKLRKITDHYKIPGDVCGTFRRTYQMLEEMEMDLHQHIHLENNILLKDYDDRLKQY